MKDKEAITELIASLLRWGEETTPDAVALKLRPYQKIILRLSKRFSAKTIAMRLSESKTLSDSRIAATDLEKCIQKWKAVRRRRGGKSGSAGGNGSANPGPSGNG